MKRLYWKIKSKLQDAPEGFRLITSICIVFSILIVLFLFVINNVLIIVTVTSESMKYTLNVSDQLYGNRLSYLVNPPARFDIVLFHPNDDLSEIYVKRVIGLPGDEILIKKGKVYVNGSVVPLEDSFCSSVEYDDGNFGPYNVPRNCYFMLGDNRVNSKDSRYWKNPYISRCQIVGKVFAIRYGNFKY